MVFSACVANLHLRRKSYLTRIKFGTPFAVAVFLIVLEAAGENHLETVWRVCFAIGIVFPLLVFYFRMRMLSPKL